MYNIIKAKEKLLIQKGEAAMKRIAVGISVIILGVVLCITGISLCAVSERNSRAELDRELRSIAESQNNRIYSGTYIPCGENGEAITLTDDQIIFSDGSKENYRLSVWENMPDTNEKTGKITYSDYCFLKTSNKNFRYYPNTKEIYIDGIFYKYNAI